MRGGKVLHKLFGKKFRVLCERCSEICAGRWTAGENREVFPQKETLRASAAEGSPFQINDRKSQNALKSTTIVFLYFLAIVFCAASADFLSG